MKTIFIVILGFLMLTIEIASAQVIDIKPGSCPNPFNGKSKGSVPVAILGSADFDVSEVDPATIELAGVPALEAWAIDNSTQPNDDNTDCFTCFDADDPANFNCDLLDENGDAGTDGVDDSYCGDEYPDLIVKFDTQELKDSIAALADLADEDVDRDDCFELELTGLTNGDFPDEIVGVDSVLIRTKIK